MAETDDPIVVGGLTASAYKRLSPWRRFTASLPMRTALGGVALVWLFGCVWSFEEQTAFAGAKGFTLPWLLPLVIDGLAAAMAGVAYAASLDARPAIQARIATAIAVAASATSNGAWAWERAGSDVGTVALAVGIPIAANVAFEVLLGELRRQIQRKRGQRPPVAIPYPRLIRLLLSPFRTFGAWRRLVLEITDPRREIAEMDTAASQIAASGTTVTQIEPAEVVTAELEPTPVVATRISSVQAEPPRIAPARADATVNSSEEQDPPTVQMPAIRPQRARVDPARDRTARNRQPARPSRPRQPLALESGQTRTNGHDGRVVRVAEMIGRGDELTGDAVGELFGCSARTGRRLLAQGMELTQGRNGDHAADRNGDGDRNNGDRNNGDRNNGDRNNGDRNNGDRASDHGGEHAADRNGDRNGDRAFDRNGDGTDSPADQFTVIGRSSS